LCWQKACQGVVEVLKIVNIRPRELAEREHSISEVQLSENQSLMSIEQFKNETFLPEL